MIKNNMFLSLFFNSKLSNDTIIVFLIIIFWIGLIFLVNPIGNFPLNDDWAYGWTVKTLLETREYQLSDWTATNLLPQVIWGTLLCLPFGFSFTALRISTLILGLLGVLASYGLLREAKANTKLALLGALVMALNPIYFGLSNSFNSDIPSLSFAIVSLYLIVRGLRLNSNFTIIAGILTGLIAVLNRQSNLVIFLAFALALLLKKGIKIKTVIIACFSVLLGLLTQGAYSNWLDYTDKRPVLYGFQIKHLRETLSGGLSTIISTYFYNAVVMLVYFGLFLFPFIVICLTYRLKGMSSRYQRLIIFLPLLMGAMGTILIFKDQQMPFVGNILGTFALGPQAFGGYSSSLGVGTKFLFYRTWELLTIVGFAGAGLLITYTISAISEVIGYPRKIVLERKWLLVLVGSATLIYLGVIGGLAQKYWFDRYLIFPLPLLMVLVTMLSIRTLDKKLPSAAIAITLAVLLFYGGFTVSATHDYLSWNRVRWQALNDLINNSGVVPEQIYGGFEFNGWYFGNRLEICNPKYQSHAQSLDIRWGAFDCLWGEDTDRFKYLYRIGLIEQSGYVIEQKYSFRRWLPWRKQDLYILKKSA